MVMVMLSLPVIVEAEWSRLWLSSFSLVIVEKDIRFGFIASLLFPRVVLGVASGVHATIEPGVHVLQDF